MSSIIPGDILITHQSSYAIVENTFTVWEENPRHLSSNASLITSTRTWLCEAQSR